MSVARRTKSLTFFHELKNSRDVGAVDRQILGLAASFVESLAPKLESENRRHWSTLFVDVSHQKRILEALCSVSGGTALDSFDCVREFAERFNRLGVKTRDAVWPHVELLCYEVCRSQLPDTDALVFADDERVGRAAARLIAARSGKNVQSTTDPRVVAACIETGGSLVVVDAGPGYGSVRAFLDFEGYPYRALEPFEAGSLEHVLRQTDS